jgi:predicted MFS family arabinose efflux permease
VGVHELWDSSGLYKSDRIKVSTSLNPYSPAYKRAVVSLLMTAYTFNAMDRTIISIISQSMKVDLKLSDTQLGLLGGTAFAVLYAAGGIPIARLAERINRVNIIAVALIIWSTLSALCGVAATFPQLLLTRAGVGVAEAGCSPPAHSLISDYFEPSQRSSALSIYSCGISLGYILAAVGGSYVVQHWGWRAACATVGLPGIGIAILIKIFIREPPRGRASLPPFSIRSEARELCAVAKALLSDPPIRHMVLGVTVGGFAAYGFYAFVHPYFRRAFGLDYTTVGVIVGLAGGVAVGAGIVAGGFIADALAKRDARWYALVPGIGGVIALPFYWLSLLQADWRLATGLLSIAGFFQYASLGPTFGVVQNVVDPRRRATATALLYIALSVLALGGGPLFTGWTTDRFAEADFSRNGSRALSPAPVAGYAVSCPGGAGAATASAELKTACTETLTRATRRGLLLTLLFFGWASVHYLLAATGIARSLRAAAR